MGLQDLLAVVLGVKTAEALQERETSRRQSELAIQELIAQSDAERAARLEQMERLTPDAIARIQPTLDRLAALVPDAEPGTVMYFGLLHLDPLYAAYLAAGDYTKYLVTLEAVGAVAWQKQEEQFVKSTRLVTEIRAADAELFDELIDAYLDTPWGTGDKIQAMRQQVGLGTLLRLPTNKPCPRCAEMVKRAAPVCRFCGYEFRSATPKEAVPDRAGSQASAQASTTPLWTPTHRVPEGGMAAWAVPDPSLTPITLDGGLELAVAERRGDWARVVAANGWTGWVDGRLLVEQHSA